MLFRFLCFINLFSIFYLSPLSFKVRNILPVVKDFQKHEFNDPFVVVSLGNTCQVAHHLERKELSKHYYPFDWVMSMEFDKVYELLANGVQDFLKWENLKQAGLTKETGELWVLNNKYTIEFRHDFKQSEDMLTAYPAVNEKYNRRIARLKALCESKSHVYRTL